MHYSLLLTQKLTSDTVTQVGQRPHKLLHLICLLSNINYDSILFISIRTSILLLSCCLVQILLLLQRHQHQQIKMQVGQSSIMWVCPTTTLQITWTAATWCCRIHLTTLCKIVHHQVCLEVRTCSFQFIVYMYRKDIGSIWNPTPSETSNLVFN